MAGTYWLEIITPERKFFLGEVESLIVATPEGRLGILKGHEPMVAALTAAEVTFLYNKEWHACASSEGFMEVRPDRVFIMAQTMEWPDEVEANRAREAKAKEDELKRQQQSIQEYSNTMISLSRTMARLRNRRSVNMD